MSEIGHWGRRAILCVAATACCLASAAAPARAQTVFREARFDGSPFRQTPPVDPFDWRRARPEAQSVVNRPRPELDPLGLPAGAARFYPSMTVGVVAEDNVRRAERGRKSDLALVASPSLYLVAEQATGRLELAFDADVYAYARTDTEDRENFDLDLLGAREIGRDLRLTARAGLAQGHEQRSSPDAGGVKSPIRFVAAAAALALAKRFGRFRLQGDLRGERLDFADVLEAGTDANINNDDRDRAVLRAGVEPAFWNRDGDGRVFARLEGVAIEYDDRTDDGGFGRDSLGVDARLGMAVNLTGVTTVDGHIGYLGQYYRDDGPTRLIEDRVEALLLGGGVTTNVTGLTSLHARLDRNLFETTIAGSPGGVRSSLDFGADHELLRNLVLSAGVGGRVLQFEGVDRDDVGLLFRFGGVYMMNRHLGLEAGLEHERLRSTGAQGGVDYAVNRFMLKLTARP